MALETITDPNALSQGESKAIADMVFASVSGMNITISSAGANLPDLITGEFFEIRDHSQTVNNGLYIATATTTTSSLTCTKVSGSAPINASSEAATIYASKRNAVADAVWASASGDTVQITSAGSNLPALVVGSRFVVEDHSTAGNNGPYEVTVLTTTLASYTVRKLTGTSPVNAASEPVAVITGTKSVMYDTAAKEIYLLEQPTAISFMDLDGTLGQAFYSFTMISWKDDNFLFGAAPFPLLCIDADAGKYVLGQDPAGNNTGWTFKDNGTHSIRTRKLLRNMGWSEVSAAGVLNYQYAGIRTLGAFLDQTAGTGDTAYYQFGTDTTVNDTVDFTFAGPVNEAIQVYNGLATAADTSGGYVITGTNTITRDSGSWITDGYKVGGKIVIFGAEDGANNGTWTISSVSALALVVTGVLVNNAGDTTAYFGVDNRSALTLRLRERTTPGNSNARTFSQSNLAAAGESVLSNRLFTFGLSNAQDLDITESDANIDANAPYTGMSITYYATPQSLGGSGALVGGPYNFGIVIVANNGTNTQVYEWVQRQLRKTSDIDNDGNVAIGVTMDGLMRFVGPTLQVGSVDGGLSFPRNPDGGGSGVYITGLNAGSSNDTVYYDNTGTVRSAPLTVAVTLDFNATLDDDPLAEYTLFFDRTIRNTAAGVTLTAVSGATGTLTCAATLPATLNQGTGAYIRISGFTGGDAAMNGVYQVTTLTSSSSYNVTRYDGATIVTTAATTITVDQNCIDTPNAIIVKDASNADVTGTISGDYTFNFDYSNNVQGGRTASTDAFVVGRAIGQTLAQPTQSSVQTISTSALTIPLASNIERNFINP